MTVAADTPLRTRPFAPPCQIAGREAELLMEVLHSGCWSGFRAGAPGVPQVRPCSSA